MFSFFTSAAATVRGQGRLAQRHSRRPLIVEWLEERTLLSVAPVSSEFRVNATVDGFQGAGEIAMAADGRFVVVWQGGHRPDGSPLAVYGQRYTTAGRRHGREFQVSTNATGGVSSPVVAMNASGGFAVAWQRWNTDLTRSDIYARLYTPAGVPRGREFQVTHIPGRGADAASVAIAADGNVVVTWRDADWTADPNIPSFEIFARLYTPRGLPRGPAFQVNTITIEAQQLPDVAMDANGNFIIAWMGGSRGDIISAQRYAATGVPQGTEFSVNPATNGFEQRPSVAMTPTGEFVVTWETCAEDNCDVHAQPYTATGMSRGNTLLVSSTQPHRAGSAVAIDARGSFIVTWEICNERGETGCTDFDVYARRYTMAGVPDGLEFRVNDTTDGFQWDASVAVSAGGNFVVMWDGRGPGDVSGVFARRYTATPVPRTFVFFFAGYGGPFCQEQPGGVDRLRDWVASEFVAADTTVVVAPALDWPSGLVCLPTLSAIRRQVARAQNHIRSVLRREQATPFDQVVLVGHSYGGNIAYNLASDVRSDIRGQQPAHALVTFDPIDWSLCRLQFINICPQAGHQRPAPKGVPLVNVLNFVQRNPRLEVPLPPVLPLQALQGFTILGATNEERGRGADGRWGTLLNPSDDDTRHGWIDDDFGPGADGQPGGGDDISLGIFDTVVGFLRRVVCDLEGLSASDCPPVQCPDGCPNGSIGHEREDRSWEKKEQRPSPA